MSFVLLGILNSQAAGAGGAPAYDHLETIEFTGDNQTWSFTGLDTLTDYKHLQIRYVARDTGTTFGSDMRFRFNNVSTTGSHAVHRLVGDGNSVSAQRQTNRGDIRLNDGAIGGSQGWAAGVIDILDFSSSSKNTTVRAMYGGEFGGGDGRIFLSSGAFFQTSAVTRIDMVDSSADTGSRFSLYGIKG